MNDNLVSHDRNKYNQQTRDIISTLANAFFNGDEDKVWERYFRIAEEGIETFGKPVDPASHGQMWIRIRPEINNK